jgi:phosphatidylserine decarboxylase
MSVANRASVPVRYYDRYAGRVVEESIYGEGWLRFVYGHPLGRLANAAVVRRAWFSVLYGALMNTRRSARKVPGFIAQFGIDMSQFEVPEAGWRHFNEFFSRHVKPGARPVAPGADTLVLPADGRHLVYPDGEDVSGLVVKGRAFSLAELLGNAEIAKSFEGGSLIVSRLCPTDYHRFHFPCVGIPSAPTRIGGPLDSVSPVAIMAGARCLCANKRELTLLRTDAVGLVAMVDVGAACVGRIVQTFQPGIPVEKGAEKGYFLFGGSTVITVFEPCRMHFADDLVAHSREGLETYARMGDVMGVVRS